MTFYIYYGHAEWNKTRRAVFLIFIFNVDILIILVRTPLILSLLCTSARNTGLLNKAALWPMAFGLAAL